MKKRLIVLALMASMAVGMARPAYAVFDKVRFATDLGVAFFAFHHWVYKPYQQQAFVTGAPHRTKALVKGGVAMLFTLNRLKAANRVVHNTKDPALQRLGGMLDGLTSSFSTMGQHLKGGQYRPEAINSLNSSIDSLTSSAAASGIQVRDVPVAIPGT